MFRACPLITCLISKYHVAKQKEEPQGGPDPEVESIPDPEVESMPTEQIALGWAIEEGFLPRCSSLSRSLSPRPNGAGAGVLCACAVLAAACCFRSSVNLEREMGGRGGDVEGRERLTMGGHNEDFVGILMRVLISSASRLCYVTRP